MPHAKHQCRAGTASPAFTAQAQLSVWQRAVCAARADGLYSRVGCKWQRQSSWRKEQVSVYRHRNWINLPKSSAYSQEEMHSFLLTLKPAHSAACIQKRENLWVNGCGFVS